MTLPQFHLETKPLAAPEAIVPCGHARFTVLTARLLRLEYSPIGEFEVRPSQAFWHRRQPVPSFQVTRAGRGVEIITAQLHLRYSGGPFTRRSLSVKVLATGKTWRAGDTPQQAGNLLGTARTLDNANGRTRLEPGLVSRAGWAVVDDSQSLVFGPDGWLEPREAKGNRDWYFFGYGHDFAGALTDFTRVAGATPLIPRWALGNWWSRYWAYSQTELTELMRDFQRHEIPLSVCIVDMDWHLTRTGNRSSGWTGYTWNRDLFPDPESFLQWLHGQGLKSALNLHPAEGVRPHEGAYADMARFMGRDPARRRPIEFDATDRRFMQGYFEILNHPLEAAGVDFWWIDWQQGRASRLPGLDPLWWLNHLHFHDLGRDSRRRPFIFSRWGGLGNHRYPIGFSGDTHVTWASLAYQPYFTATAANVGYGWWSHDIGGHMHGTEDPELYARWVQFGVFSPIFRLHSTNNPYLDRRPWAWDAETLRVVREAMQLRHALIPYLYSMAWRNHRTGVPLITPLYYSHPDEPEAYNRPGQYWFGSELVAAPFVAPADPEIGLSRHSVWLPEGEWFNFFTGERLSGGAHALYGALEDIPIFARAGAIVPLGPRPGWGGLSNPERLTVHVFPGADNRFELYEDDGETTTYQTGAYAVTSLAVQWRDTEMQVTVEPVQGDAAVAPAAREYEFVLHGVRRPESVRVTAAGQERDCAWAHDAATDSVSVEAVSVRSNENLAVTMSAAGPLRMVSDRRAEYCRRLLRAMRLPSEIKRRIDADLPALLHHLPAKLVYPSLSRAQRIALREILAQ